MRRPTLFTRCAIRATTLGAGLLATGIAAAADLTISLANLESEAGHVLVALHATAQSWDGDERPTEGRRIAAVHGSEEISFADLAPGHYAVMVHHDENDNGEMDANLVGIPSEGYGFSNNPPVMRKATFAEAAVEVGEGSNAITIELR